ncbi:MAG: hypothetical protein ACOC82_02140 [Candidatus Bipolaricaulota bacterium]
MENPVERLWKTKKTIAHTVEKLCRKLSIEAFHIFINSQEE